MLRCDDCGAWLEPEWSFCGKCGRPVGRASPEQRRTDTAEQAAHPSSKAPDQSELPMPKTAAQAREVLTESIPLSIAAVSDTTESTKQEQPVLLGRRARVVGGWLGFLAGLAVFIAWFQYYPPAPAPAPSSSVASLGQLSGFFAPAHGLGTAAGLVGAIAGAALMAASAMAVAGRLRFALIAVVAAAVLIADGIVGWTPAWHDWHAWNAFQNQFLAHEESAGAFGPVLSALADSINNALVSVAEHSHGPERDWDCRRLCRLNRSRECGQGHAHDATCVRTAPAAGAVTPTNVVQNPVVRAARKAHIRGSMAVTGGQWRSNFQADRAADSQQHAGQRSTGLFLPR